MPGGGHRYEWIGKAPWYLRTVFWNAFGEFAVGWFLGMTLSKWARSTPDTGHPVELKMRFGHVYYLSPRLGWFLNNDLWIFFGLLGLLALIMVLHRDKLGRVS